MDVQQIHHKLPEWSPTGVARTLGLGRRVAWSVMPLSRCNMGKHAAGNEAKQKGQCRRELSSYLMAIICVRPQGSNTEGTRNISHPA